MGPLITINDNFRDNRTEVKYSEVATHYNAGFQSAVAGLGHPQLASKR